MVHNVIETITLNAKRKFNSTWDRPTCLVRDSSTQEEQETNLRSSKTQEISTKTTIAMGTNNNKMSLDLDQAGNSNKRTTGFILKNTTMMVQDNMKVQLTMATNKTREPIRTIKHLLNQLNKTESRVMADQGTLGHFKTKGTITTPIEETTSNRLVAETEEKDVSKSNADN